MHIVHIVHIVHMVTFDPKKEKANLAKHGVSLTEGDDVLADPLALTMEDETAEGEQRFISLGMNAVGVIARGHLDRSRRRRSDHFGTQS